MTTGKIKRITPTIDITPEMEEVIAAYWGKDISELVSWHYRQFVEDAFIVQIRHLAKEILNKEIL
jgi:hypothetical protein